MPYNASEIASWFVARARENERVLSIMELLKYVYIAQGWHLEMHDQPLFLNKIEAWKYGPVVPDVYKKFRQAESYFVDERQAAPVEHLDASTKHLLEQIYSKYGHLSPFRLSEITHEKDGPWDEASTNYGYYAPISNESIKRHYREKREAANKAMQ
jgi:uncharacterized phage-associated protein